MSNFPVTKTKWHEDIEATIDGTKPVIIELATSTVVVDGGQAEVAWSVNDLGESRIFLRANGWTIGGRHIYFESITWGDGAWYDTRDRRVVSTGQWFKEVGLAGRPTKPCSKAQAQNIRHILRAMTRELSQSVLAHACRAVGMIYLIQDAQNKIASKEARLEKLGWYRGIELKDPAWNEHVKIWRKMRGQKVKLEEELPIITKEVLAILLMHPSREMRTLVITLAKNKTRIGRREV